MSDARAGVPEPSLAALERRLRDRLNGARLVLEAGLDAETQAAVRAAVAAIAHRSNQPEEILRLSFPATLVTYLVSEGVENYRAGSYWPNLSVRRLQPIALGPAFEHAISKLRLEEFDQLAEDRALRFVAPILAHGGVPKYSVGDFFRLLLPELRRYGNAQAGDLVAIWRARKTAFQTIDVPVRRFMLYGGETAMDFLDRCIDLARVPRDEIARATVEELALPQYVIEAYLGQSKSFPIASAGSAPIAAPRPRIVFDPWDQLGPVGVLPIVPAGFRSANWSVDDGSHIRQVPASRIASQTVTLAPALTWEIGLVGNPAAERTYAFDCLSDSPFICFDPATGAFVRDSRPVVLDELWTLAPEGTKIAGLNAAGDWLPVGVLARLPNPSGPWSGFVATHVDLRNILAIEAVRVSPSGEARSVVRVVRPGDRPTLVGDPVSEVATVGGVPVYGALPDLRVPEIAGYPPSNWAITLRTSASARTATLATLGIAGQPIALASLAPDLSFGSFEIAVRGPLGSDLRAQFVVIPGLTVRVPIQLLMPHSQGALVQLAAAQDVSLGGAPAGHPISLQVPDQGDEVRVEVESGGESLELHVRVAKLLWGLKYADRSALLSNTSAVVDRTDIEDGNAEALLVSTFRPAVELRLTLEASAEPIQATETAASSARDGRWAFDLRPFRDTLRASDEPLLEFVLTADGSPVVAAQVVSRPLVSNIRARLSLDESVPVATIVFQESRRLRGRVIRLWSLDRPWEEPISSVVLSDDATEATVQSERIMPGSYRVEIAVDDAWFGIARPRRDAANTADVHLGTAGEIAQRLRNLDVTEAISALELAVVDGYRADGTVAISETETSAAVVTTRALLNDADPSAPVSRNLAAVTELTFSRAGWALDAIATLYRDEVLDKADVQALTVLALKSASLFEVDQVGEITSRTLWQASPSLAAMVDVGRAIVGDPDAAGRCDQFMGWRPDGALPPPGEGMSLQWLGASAQQVALIRDAVGLVPQRILSLDSYVVANFEWLLAAKQDDALVGDWWQRFGWFERDDVPSVPHSGTFLLPRKRPTHPDRWAGIPQALLAAALSLTSRDEHMQEAAEALRAAMRIAPSLTDHDLCLARILTSTAMPGALTRQKS